MRNFLLFFWTRYLPTYSRNLTYMLQASEYKIRPYLKWFHRTYDFRRVMNRQTLDLTTKARLIVNVLAATSFVLALIISGFVFASLVFEPLLWWLVIGLVFVSPFILAYGILLLLWIGHVTIQKPKQAKLVKRARGSVSGHPAVRIAVLGSYGKTTAKEMLKTVLSSHLKVAATPGNMNTVIGVSRFIDKLDGDEDVLIVEFGEERPGDIRELARLVKPDIAIITGINEAHLSSFKTLDRTIKTVYEIEEFVEAENIYQNIDNEIIAKHQQKGVGYSQKGVDGWKVVAASTSVNGTKFDLKRDKTKLHVETQLLGLHTIGISAAVAVIADKLRVPAEKFESGFREVKPFKHRMQPKQLHGALVIDDTYNGNKDGVKAGLELLAQLQAKRRIYVTPGLVEQGSATETVHIEIGKQAAVADVVVLMKNSTTRYIESGLKQAGFKGKLMIIDKPLDFYNNLDQFVASGDVVLMQNDWTDNYA